MALHFTGQVTNNFELIEPNDYETTINLEYKKTNAGELYINCKFAIRDDVEQDFQRRIVFDGIYKSKATGEFQANKINALLAAVNANEEHPRWDFDDYDDVIQFLNDKKVKVTVEMQKADLNNPSSSDRNTIKFLSYRPTEYKEVVYTAPITQNAQPVFEQPILEPTKQEETVEDKGFSFDVNDLPF